MRKSRTHGRSESKIKEGAHWKHYLDFVLEQLGFFAEKHFLECGERILLLSEQGLCELLQERLDGCGDCGHFVSLGLAEVSAVTSQWAGKVFNEPRGATGGIEMGVAK